MLPSRINTASLLQLATVVGITFLNANNAVVEVEANPKSRPYVAYRTNPFDQEEEGKEGPRRILEDGKEQRGIEEGGSIRKNKVKRRSPTNQNEEEDARCPLSFRLGSTHSAHFGGSSPASSSSTDSESNNAANKRPNNNNNNNNAGGSNAGGNTVVGVGTHTPPVIHPLHPDFDAGSGRQILLTTDYEVLEMWTPSSAIGTQGYDFRPATAAAASGGGRGGDGGSADKRGGGDGGGGGGGVEGTQSTEQMKEDEQFPLLFEGSSFYHTSPIVHDVEGDGIADAILGDYDGNLHLVGLDFESSKEVHGHHHPRRRRHYRRISVPRLYVRKLWYEYAINRSTSEEEVVMSNNNNNNNTNTTSEGNKTKWEEFEPYHTYFAGAGDDAWRGKMDEEALRGVSGDVLNMDVDLAKGLAERRKLLQKKKTMTESDEKEEDGGKGGKEGEEGAGGEEGEEEVGEGSARHRRLEEANEDEAGDADQTNGGSADNYANADAHEGGGEGAAYSQDDYLFDEEPGLYDDGFGAPPDGTEDTDGTPNWGDDAIPQEERDETMQGGDFGDDAYGSRMHDDYYPGGYHGDDYYKPEAPEGWDSHEEYQEAQDKYFHDSNYLRLPPHLLSTCSLAELPRQYAGPNAKAEDRVDELLLCAVSYYFDEDECKNPDSRKATGAGKSFGKHANVDGGDETEVQRGRYVANAIMGYNLRWKYWSVQEVLDLSTDWSAPLGDLVEGGTASVHSDAFSGMGAWALATPIAVKLDGGETNHIVVGTSMGLVYVLEAQWHNSKTGWPVQMRHPVEQKVLVEDVVGNTNLEVFVVDAGGDVVSLNADGGVLWARNLLRNEETMMESKSSDVQVVRGTSPMSMGDVEGTGRLAIVLLARIATTDKQHIGLPDKYREVSEYRLYAIDAVTGDDLPHFPIGLEGGSNGVSASTMPQPLLIDLHEDQHHWLDQMHGLSEEKIEAIRAINMEASRQYDVSESSKPRPHGGSGRGLHVVQPLGSTLHIIEGSTSCEQTVDVGDNIPSMVQADDVHGTGGLDLVVTTSRGEILTLESDVVPYHPLNVWSAGVSRAPGSGNAQAHGFSSSQGIFVHPISRQFRDVLGIYIPITFEIFDRRPGIENEPNRKAYEVEVRAGMSVKRVFFSHKYDTPGVYTERIQIPYGPGYYAFSVRLMTTHGIVYEDTFHLGWNVNYMGGLWLIVCLPLILAAIPILMFKRKPNWEEDEDYGSRGAGILGREPPP